MRKLSLAIIGFLAVPFTGIAQVPHLLNYQGRVTVDNVNFHGTGQFKFALVSESGDETYWSNDGTSTAGAEPMAAVTRPVVHGLYQVQLGDTALANMGALPPSVFQRDNVWLRVWFSDGTNGFEQLSPDSRIAAVAYAMMADGVRPGGVTGEMIAPGAVDGTHIGSGTITAANIAPGVLGGGGSVPSGGMLFSAEAESSTLAAAGFQRIGRNDLGGERWQARSAIQQFPNRQNPLTVWTGTEMIVWGGNDFPSPSQLFGDGALYNPLTNTWRRMSSVGAPSPRRDATVVWTGTEMIVWGGYDYSTGFGTEYHFGDGASYNPSTDTWTPLPTAGAPPSPRGKHTAVWTGSEMIIWGGENGSSYLNDGARYQPLTGTWLSMSGSSGLIGRDSHVAVWTGSQMIVFGGYGVAPAFPSGDRLGDGARYNPYTDTWSSMANPANFTGDALTAVWTGSRMLVQGGGYGIFSNFQHAKSYDPVGDSWTDMSDGGPDGNDRKSVWTGTEMIVYGSSTLGEARRYHPGTNAWQTLPSNGGIPANRDFAGIVWTGTEMIVWGDAPSTQGSRYNPATNTWSLTAPADFGTTAPRMQHSSIWTGNEAVVFGGTSATDGTANVAGGARYEPESNTWIPLSSSGEPSPRISHTAVWTGTQMIVWGGRNGNSLLGDGARYDLATHTWTPVSSAGAPSPRYSHSAVWTGSHMLVFGGGIAGSAAANDAFLYDPGTDTWSPAAAPPLGERLYHSAVWTGTELIVWGGFSPGVNISGVNAVSDGARYNPTTDTWTLLPPVSSSLARYFHAAVWSGNEMLIFGGFGPENTPVNTGLRYRPSEGVWKTMSTLDAPDPRAIPGALWSGSELLIWGGSSSGGATLGTGARYSPGADEWTPLTTTNAPGARTTHTALWTGTRMLVFGGFNGTNALNDVSLLIPGRTLFIYQQP